MAYHDNRDPFGLTFTGNRIDIPLSQIFRGILFSLLYGNKVLLISFANSDLKKID